MNTVTTAVLEELLNRVGDRLDRPARLYLVGGCAMLTLGSLRATKDIDYDVGADNDAAAALQEVLGQLAIELELDLEFVPMAEFIPLPPGAQERHRFVRRYGQLDVLIFDPYSVALSKIARGFEADIDDVVFLVRTGVVEMATLRALFEAVLPDAASADIQPTEFRAYFAEVVRRTQGGAP